ncbi:unnamed protein product [Arabis nemorensis]|uniref:Uncharacterized protein n=1 Tax=Arabis nemorensis TaxID=586526 RepID=A0A565APD5_9BRAS|nr:unnamed protein product [Arabis nemorensis]
MGDSSGNSNRVKLRDGAGRRAWGVYFLFYDRSGYGESDSNTKRSLESEVDDIAELADQLKIGPKFYIIGSYPTWGCLKHIPHRQFN